MESLSYSDLASAEKAYRHLLQRKVGSYHPFEEPLLAGMSQEMLKA